MYGLPNFTVGGALRQTFDIVKRHGGRLLALTLVLYALPSAALALLPKMGLGPDVAALQAAAAAGERMPASSGLTLVGYGLITVAVVFLGSLLATAAVVWVAHEGLYRRTASFGSAAGRGFRVLPANLAMIVILSLAVMVGFLLLVIPGVMLLLRWSVAIPALVVERTGVLGSLGRSRDLTQGHRWAILGFLLVLALIDFVVFGLIGFGGGLLAATLAGSGAAPLVQVVTVAVNAMLSAFNGAATAALYFELRRAGEGGSAIETADAFA